MNTSTPPSSTSTVESAQQALQASEAARLRGDHRLGADLAQQALQAASAQADDALQARAQALLARHRFCLGEFEACIRLAQQALDHFCIAGDLASQSALHGQLAMGYERAELGRQSLAHAAASLDTARASGDRLAECMALQRVGMASEDLDDIDRGLAFVRQALDLARQIGHDEAIFSALNNLACRGLGKADRLGERGEDATATLQTACADARAALDHAQRGGNPYFVALAQSNLAPILRRLGLRDEARQVYEACAALSEQRGYRNLRVNVSLGLGIMACDDPQRSDGPEQLESIVPALARHGDNGTLLRAHRKLYQVYQALGRPADALRHHERLHALELQVREVRADLQSRVLINRVELDEARHAAERARLEGEVQRLRADSTERKAERLARDHALLEGLVDLRTAELQRAKDEAEAADRAKTAFLAVVSHELRTPLNAVLGMTELALRRAVDERQAAQLRHSLSAGGHLRDLINDILDISAIESQSLRLEPQAFDLLPLLDAVLLPLQAAAAAKGLVLRRQVDAELPPRWVGDTVRLKQILLTFLGNAIKFSDRGAVLLQVGPHPVRGERVGLRFEVVDQGVGIDADQQARLFQTFVPGDDTSTRRHGGAGLGLALAARLARLMDGDVGLHSQPGQGSTFWACVSLPVAQAPAPAAPSDAVSDRLRQRHAGARVLLVEDTPVSREVALAMLEDVGLVVEVAADGLAGVDMVRERAYDLVLMDLQMPGLDGLEATRQIRQLPGRQALPILALTAHAYADDRQRCLAAGMNDHLAKPLDMAQLHAAVLKVLDERQGSGCR